MIVAAVGVSASALDPARKARAAAVQAAMEAAVAECLAEGLRPSEDAATIRARMQAARDKALAGATPAA